MSQPVTRSDGAREQTPEERRVARMAQNQALIALLESWENEDPQEQRETLELLMRTLDEDRPSSRKLFES